MNRSLRKRKLISYYEPDEPPFDEYVYCDECRDFVYEYCSIHGELLVIPDDKVPSETGFPSFVPRAALTIPRSFLHLAQSIIPGAGLGVFSTLTLPRGVRFGPYQGRQTQEVKSMYCWQTLSLTISVYPILKLYDANNKPHAVIDAEDASAANWMRYVNCARHWREQNLVAYQYRGRIYYRTVKIIPRFTELMVFYGSEFANLMHISLGTYNIPSHYNNTNEGTKNDINHYNDNSYKIEDSEIDYLIEEEDDTIIEYVEELRNAEDKNYDIVVYDDEVSTAASATADDNNQICIDYNLENNNLISTYNSDQTQQNNFQCHTYACAQFLQNISTQLQQYISEQCQQNTNVQLQQKINSQLQITFAQLQQNINEQLQQIIHNQLQQNNTQFQQNSTESQQNIKIYLN
ncbi:uncharacterized protein LOC131842789 [Achroia grisella]|uniref:uncharacterized protein LOC131842789 n=1 Tax=Achroia grisella TaxID=688607 RepID=UPI0027D2DC88|nr:uncharacterized protein LOC131842789 [Achroia grisella]